MQQEGFDFKRPEAQLLQGNNLSVLFQHIGFFAMSKNAEPLIRQMQERIDAAKAELKALAEQVKALNETENN